MDEGGKIKRSLESLKKTMEVVEDEINYRKEKYEKVDVVKDCEKYLKCTKCDKSFKRTITAGQKVGVHPLLCVLMCSDCCDYFGDGDFSLGSDGEDKYCRWCGEGGILFSCSKCICGFCDNCIKKHFGEEGLEKIQNDDDWLCYICDPKPLWDLRSVCSLAKEASKKKKLKKRSERRTKDTKWSGGEISDESSESKNDSDYFETRKRTRRKTQIARSATRKLSVSSSEDEKENRKRKKKIVVQENVTTDDEKPKKRQKVQTDDDEESDKEFKERKNAILKILTGIWTLIEKGSNFGLKKSKTRVRALQSKKSSFSFQTLQEEWKMVKATTESLISVAAACEDSIKSTEAHKLFEEVKDDKEVLQSQETILKSISQKVEEIEKLSSGEERGSSTNNKSTGLKVKKKSQQSDSRIKESDLKKDEVSENLSKEHSADKSKSLFSEDSPDDDQENCKVEVNASTSPKPLLKVKSFARMLTENSINSGQLEKGTVSNCDGEKGVIIENDKIDDVIICSENEETDKKKQTNKDEYNADTDEDEKNVCKKKKRRKNKKNNSTTENSSSDDESLKTTRKREKNKKKNSATVNSSSDEESLKITKKEEKNKKKNSAPENSSSDESLKITKKEEKNKKKNSATVNSSSDEESLKTTKNEEKNKKKNSATENSSSDESLKITKKEEKNKRKNSATENSSSDEESLKITRKGKKNKNDKNQFASSFDKFREKRKMYLKSKQDSSEDETLSKKINRKKAVESDSDSSVTKTDEKKSQGKIKKRVIASSDEEGGTKEDRKSEKEDDENCDSNSEVSQKVSSDETSNDEITEKSKYKKEKRKKKISSGSESSDREEDKKKKGRKNIKKILKKESLVMETKEAVKNEEERVKRVRGRQKLLEETFPDQVNPDGSLNKLILDFDSETKEPLVTVHKKLVKKLKPHQAKGVRFMWDNCFESVQKLEENNGSGCILAHCMGLGKTLQTITLVHTVMSHDIGVNTVLVICPLSTVQNWINEFEGWLSKIHTDPITLYELSKSKRVDARCFHLKNWHNDGGVMVLSYNIFRVLTKGLISGKKKKSKALQTFETALLDPGPDLVICDEGHLLKNEDSALSKCVSKIKTARRIVLTGTPLQNNLMEYHCMVQFVKPNILGTKKEFCNRFVNPINNGQFEDSTEHDVKIMKRRSHVLHSMLEGCVQRFDYSVLKPYLPEKHEYVLSISLTESQAKVYLHFIQNLSGKAGEDSGGKTKAARLFNDYHNLHRIWTHPRALLMHCEKESQKEWDEDSEGSLKDFVVDNDESSEDTADSDIEEIPVKKRILRSNADDPEVQTMIEEEEKNTEKKWWTEFFKESDFEDLQASNKLIVLFSLLKHCGEVKDKVLVFSQSLYSLDLIEHFLKKIDDSSQESEHSELLGGHKDSWVLGIDYFRLDGSTKELDRNLWCKHFNKEKNTRARLFLVSTRAGGLGINLYGANRVVIFDASWNPSHDLQSIFRIYRFGQKKPCFIYRFLAEATMEEKIYERQVTKLSLAHRVVDEHQIERHYTMMNLQELYNYEPLPPEKRKIPKVPKDPVLADLLQSHKNIIVDYFEHDSLLENREEEELTEEERKAAWDEYENEKQHKLLPQMGPQMAAMFQGTMPPIWQGMPAMMRGGFPQFVQNPAAFMVQGSVVNPMFANPSSLPFPQMGVIPNPGLFYNT